MTDNKVLAMQALIEDKIAAVVKMIGHTGAQDFELRWNDDKDPIIWFAVATYRRGTNFPGIGESVDIHHAVGAGITPLDAVIGLASTLVDGGKCVHCKRPTAFQESADRMPLADYFCWYQYVPELKVVRRGCQT